MADDTRTSAPELASPASREAASLDAPPLDAPPLDPGARWIRITGERPSGMVEFEFAVGEPQLFVELVMGRAEFDTFCAAQGVVPTRGPLAAAEGDAHEFDWSMREARARHFRHED